MGWTVGSNVIGVGQGVVPVPTVRSVAGQGSIGLPGGTAIGDGLVIRTCGRDAPTWGPNALAQTEAFAGPFLSNGFYIRIGRVLNLDPIDVTANNSNGAADAFVYVTTIPGAEVDASRVVVASNYVDGSSPEWFTYDPPWGESCPGFLALKAAWGGIGGSYGAGPTYWDTEPSDIAWQVNLDEGSYMSMTTHWSAKPVPPGQVRVSTRNASGYHHIVALKPVA